MCNLLTRQINVETKSFEDRRWPVSKKTPTIDLNGQVDLNPWKKNPCLRSEAYKWNSKLSWWSINTVAAYGSNTKKKIGEMQVF